MKQLIKSPHKALLGIGGLSLAIILVVRAGFAQDMSPERTITEFHNSLINILRESQALGYQGRFNRLKPRIIESFHLPVMLRISLGRFWQKASKSQRERLMSVFVDVSVGTYATRLSDYSGQTFITKGSREGPQNTILVDTTLQSPTSLDIPITYVTSKFEGKWRVIDILLSTGISELALRRSEYRRNLKSGGIEGLIATLTAKVNELSLAH